MENPWWDGGVVVCWVKGWGEEVAQRREQSQPVRHGVVEVEGGAKQVRSVAAEGRADIPLSMAAWFTSIGNVEKIQTARVSRHTGTGVCKRTNQTIEKAAHCVEP